MDSAPFRVIHLNIRAARPYGRELRAQGAPTAEEEAGQRPTREVVSAGRDAPRAGLTDFLGWCWWCLHAWQAVFADERRCGQGVPQSTWSYDPLMRFVSCCFPDPTPFVVRAGASHRTSRPSAPPSRQTGVS
jgi:hypothetical protein